MRYLGCIEMLNYALKILKHDSRQSVQLAKMGELLGCVKSIEAMCMEEQALDIMSKTTILDLMSAILTVKNNSEGMLTLTDTMKTTLINGVMQVKSSVCKQAVVYYDTHDFDVTDATIPIFKDMVQTFYEAGGRLT